MKLSPDIQHRIAELRTTRPYDGRRVTLRESRGGWKYTGISGICTRLAADHHYMVLVVEHDPQGYWPIGMEILAELDHESIPMFHDPKENMHCIDDKANGIILNHDGDWSGRVRIAWYVTSERRDPGPTPPSLRACWCDGPSLVAGRFTPIGAPPNDDEVQNDELPINVLTRAVALAVEAYLCGKMESALDDICIQRGKL